MKKFGLILSWILISCWASGQTIQNGQNGSNFTSIDQIAHDDQLVGQQDHSVNINTLLETYNEEIWVIEFTSDSTFVITEVLLKGLIDAYHADSVKSPVDMMESKLGKTIYQVSQSRNMDMLLYTENPFGNKSGNPEYRLLEDMVKTSDITIISNEKEFYKELDNMVSGILVNVVFKPEEEITPTLHERLEGLQNRQGAINPGIAEQLFRTQIGN